METKNLSNPQADTDAQFVKFRHPAETMKRISGNPALGERMIFLRKTGSVSPKETTCFSEGYVSFLRKKHNAYQGAYSNMNKQTKQTAHRTNTSYRIIYQALTECCHILTPHKDRTVTAHPQFCAVACGLRAVQKAHSTVITNYTTTSYKVSVRCAVKNMTGDSPNLRWQANRPLHRHLRSLSA